MTSFDKAYFIVVNDSRGGIVSITFADETTYQWVGGETLGGRHSVRQYEPGEPIVMVDSVDGGVYVRVFSREEGDPYTSIHTYVGVLPK